MSAKGIGIVIVLIIIVIVIGTWFWAISVSTSEQDRLIAAGCEPLAFNQLGIATAWSCP